ncbi:MAG: hypothetical protein ACKVP6_14665, partial [Mycobacterium sp.]
MAVNKLRIWVAGAALGFALAGPTAFGTANAEVGESDAPAATADAGTPNHRASRAGRVAPGPRATVVTRSSAPRLAADRLSRVGGRAVAGARTSTRLTLPVDQILAPAAQPNAVARATRSVATDPTRRAVAAANPVEEFLTGAKVWVDTFANFYPWWSGSLLPPPVRQIFFNATPVAAPMQIELDLAAGISSQAIGFTASDADGNRLLYSVPGTGLPGAPQRGIVVVD